MKSTNIKNIILCAIFIAIGIILPFFTGQVPEIGNALLPMHLPVLLCGIICGPRYGALVGFITPIMRSLMFGMPPIFPTATAMAFELAAYAIVIGIVYNLLKGKRFQTYIALISSMICGRIVWGAVTFVLLGVSGSAFSFEAFLAGAILSAIPGIILQLILVPLIIIVLKSAKVFEPSGADKPIKVSDNTASI